MERMLVVVFDTEGGAYDASEVLNRLSEGSVITIYAEAIVTKDKNGATTVNQIHHEAPEGTLGGTALGSLIGLLAGPMGLVMGAATGLVVGATTDSARAHVSSDFVTAVSTVLEAGKAAVVAEVYEESTGPVDERMKALGGFVLRRDLADVRDGAYEEDITTIQEDIAKH
jgi:uncharacterized membrane protein